MGLSGRRSRRQRRSLIDRHPFQALADSTDDAYIDLLIALAKAANSYQSLAPGVHGVIEERSDGLYVPLIVADHPGHGDVGRYLNSLPHDRKVVVPMVVNERLRGMLARRGFVRRIVYEPVIEQYIEVFVRDQLFQPAPAEPAADSASSA
jgi:hypothetical protein